ncbi:MAG TPA: serine/threonine-protein kinase [Gaiellaceae bacterium]|nr:serine/threonine-protein kinase [Gaiellaceae bacterium]
MPATHEAPLPPRYRDVRLIARGGMGEVYRATDSELGRDVAIKVLSSRFADDVSFRARFEREAMAAARLSGFDNTVTIFDVAEYDGRPLIVMEFLPGGSLERRIADAPRGEVVQWLADAATGLDAAHAVGIVHRDVKPANLLFDGRGHIHVADFGIASAAGLASVTQTGSILGTAGYLSPEQARGERATPASDRYGLAVVAWELLAGRRPFESTSSAAEATAHVREPVPDIRDLDPSLPVATSAVFERALAKDPAARYPTAQAFVDDLQRSFVGAPAAPKRDYRPWIVVVAGILVAAGLVAGILSVGGGGGDRATTVVRTVTHQGTTVQETVTTTATTTAATAATTPQQTVAAASGTTLNNEGYAKMRARDFTGALPLLEQAVGKLRGSGSLDEAYADYNLAYTRRALGQCTDVLALLDNSQRIQGHRFEIDRLRRDAQRAC